MSLTQVAINAGINGAAVIGVSYVVAPEAPFKRRVKLAIVGFATMMLYDFIEMYIAYGYASIGWAPGAWTLGITRTVLVGTGLYVLYSKVIAKGKISEKQAIALAGGMVLASSFTRGAFMKEVAHIKGITSPVGPGLAGLNSRSGYALGNVESH